MPFCDKCGVHVAPSDKYCFRCSNKLPRFTETIDAMTYVEKYYATGDNKNSEYSSNKETMTPT